MNAGLAAGIRNAPDTPNMMVFQIQLTKRRGVVPITGDYIAAAEARLRAVEQGSRPPLCLAGK